MANSIAVSEDLIFVADQSDGLEIIKIIRPSLNGSKSLSHLVSE